MIVVDANILASALRSRNGASFGLLRMMLEGSVVFCCSPAILFEYEDVLKRPPLPYNISIADIEIVLDTLAMQCKPVRNWYLFRPFLDDPKGDLYVECALAAGVRHIVTFDRHFHHLSMQMFGLNAIRPGDFLKMQKTGDRQS
jgi:putative PIN family toxin of toxin-antitoxin system